MASADNSSNAAADLRHHLAVDPSPFPIPKDMHGSDSSIPLSPQWLLAKPAENKLGIFAGEPHSSPHGNRPDIARTSEIGEDSHDAGKRKSVFRPSTYDLDSGRHDRWRDEERETRSAIRHDRWREQEKELGDTRRTERRAPNEWRTDSGNRDSKWNTRWGPDDKESEPRREKWSDSRDKGTSQQPIPGKDTDKEGEHSRSWRSNSFLARGRGDPNLSQPLLTPPKQSPTFGYGRGKAENVASFFSAGRGRVDTGTGIVNNGTSHSYPLGFARERRDSAHGDRYSRMKLLDIFRTTDLKSYRMSLDGFIDVPSLTIEEPLEPLALSAPTSEELATLKGIDKGDIVNSVLPQVSKEGSTGKNSADFVMSKQARLGSGNREDTPTAFGDYKDESSNNMNVGNSNYLESPYEKYSHQQGLDSKVASSQNVGSYRENTFSSEGFRSEDTLKNVDQGGTKEVNMLERSSSHHATPLRSQWQNNELHSERNKDFKINNQSSDVLNIEREDRIFQLSASKFSPSVTPEDLSLYYKDPQDRIQGPFSGGDLIGWFEAGYFGIDLPVRLASAPSDAPFSSLGDAMPHLKAKARPPPGFGAAKLNDLAEVSIRGIGSVGGNNNHAAIGEFEAIKNMHRNRHEAVNEAENRFIESLMSANLRTSSGEHYSFAEGMQGSGGGGSSSLSDVNYLLAQKLSLERERERTVPTAVPYWSGRDPSSVGTKPDMIPESPTPHSKILPIPQSSPQVDFLSLLQAVNKPTSPAVNSAPVWPNFTDVSPLNNLGHGDLDITNDKIGVQHQRLPMQSQHQRLPMQSQASLSHLLNHPVDLSSGVIPPEKLLAAEVSQDPQLLNVLQQQYIMSQLQLHSQSSLPSNLSLFDKYILLKQQLQKEEQQQQQQLLLQQQQQLLSQVLSGHQPHQPFGEPSFGHLNAPTVDPGLRQMHATLQNSQKMPILNSLDGRSTNISNLNVQGLSTPYLPHQMLDRRAQSEEWNNLQKETESVPESKTVANSFLSVEPIEKTLREGYAEQKNVLEHDNHLTDGGVLPASGHAEETTLLIETPAINGIPSVTVSSVSEKVNDVNISSESNPEESYLKTPPAKAIKDGDIKEAKKVSEKKSRKQKNAKTSLVSGTEKGSSKSTGSQQLKANYETEGANSVGKKAELQIESDESLHISMPLESELNSSVVTVGDSSTAATEVGFAGKPEQGEVGMTSVNSQTSSSHRAWKPAPGLKPKSLLEIQQEEKHRLRTEVVASETSTTVVPKIFSPTPWAGVVANVDHQSRIDVQYPSVARDALENSANSLIPMKSRKSQLHDVLAEEVLAKSNDGSNDIPEEKSLSLHSLPQVGAQAETQSVDDDFIEAKDTKKSRKKAAKAKSAGLKASPPVTSSYLSVPPVTVERSKSSRQMQQEKEALPVPPVGPSLGDFVLWKGEQPTSSAAPAWSTESTKVQKTTSLRDILKEQEKKGPSVQQQIPIPTPAKVQSSRGNRGSGSTWPAPGSSPLKAASPRQTKAVSPIQTASLTSSQSKSKTEDDLFWGPLDQSKQDSKQLDFPSLASPNNQGGKGTSVKGTLGVSSARQKPAGLVFTSPASGQSSSKGKRDATSKHSEAMDFREWCESEIVKLTGTNDTNFLEFCLKQSTSEAEMLLRENLGSIDRNHEFIDKFLNYKDFLSPDIIETAFHAQSSRKVSKDDYMTSKENETDGGRKKGKKGKKVSPTVLGFNVVSNRIMMGEIQTVED